MKLWSVAAVPLGCLAGLGWFEGAEPGECSAAAAAVATPQAAEKAFGTRSHL